METALAYIATAGLIATVPLGLWFGRKAAASSGAVVIATFVAAALFMSDGGGGFVATPVNLSYLRVTEGSAPAQVGELTVEAFVLDGQDRETVYFGEEFAESPVRLYDATNDGVEVRAVTTADGAPYTGALTLFLETIQEGAISGVEATVSIQNGVGIWHGQPLPVVAGTQYRINQISVGLPASVSSLDSQPMVSADIGSLGSRLLPESSGVEQSATLHTFSRYSDGNVATSELESRDEIVSAMETDGRFQAAVRDLCQFSVTEVQDIVIRTNDTERYQASYSGSGWIAADATIPAGQPVWMLVPQEGKGSECTLNPPCGNPPPPPPPTPTPVTPSPSPTPTTPPGEIEIVKFWDEDEDCVFDSDEQFVTGVDFWVSGPANFNFTSGTTSYVKSVPTGTYTVEEFLPSGWRPANCSQAVKTVKVEAGKRTTVYFGNVKDKNFTQTPKPTPTPTPSKTPTPTPTMVTSTPTKSPTPTPSKTPTPTPTQPPSLIFGCPDFLEHGSEYFTRVGIVVSNYPVTWDVTGATIVSEASKSLTLQANEGAHVIVKAKAKNWNSGWVNACVKDVPVSVPGATPEPSRTPAPTLPPPTGPTPSPQWTPPPP